MKLTVEHLSEDKLSREVWEATFMVEWSKGDIRIQYWATQSRPTRRHGWRASESWYSQPSRTTRVSTVKTPPVPEDVVAEFRAKAAEAVAKLPVIY